MWPSREVHSSLRDVQKTHYSSLPGLARGRLFCRSRGIANIIGGREKQTIRRPSNTKFLTANFSGEIASTSTHLASPEAVCFCRNVWFDAVIDDREDGRLPMPSPVSTPGASRLCAAALALGTSSTRRPPRVTAAATSRKTPVMRSDCSMCALTEGWRHVSTKRMRNAVETVLRVS